MPSSTRAVDPRNRRTCFAGRMAGLALPLSALSVMTACLDESIVRQPNLDIVPGTPPGWVGTVNTLGVGLTSSDVHSGTQAAYLSVAFQSFANTSRLVQHVRADDYRGKRVRLSAWVKPRNVGSAASSGVFMRVDGPGVILESDDMIRRVIVGAGAWRQVSVVLDVPERAVGLSFGAVFQAANTLLVDEMTFEVVGGSVESTNTLPAPISNGLDSLGTVELYARSPRVPLNLDFEGLASLAGSAATWLTENAVPLATADPAAGLDDLASLDQLVGSASVVALGEATPGTREFLHLKHRLTRRLVEHLGFTMLAIDAPTSETTELNAYVQGGSGDLPRLLSSLYAWHLNTQEFADFIGWLRAWNATVANDRRVSLIGLDVLHPGAAMDSVASFVKRVAPAFEADIEVWYQCLDAFRNRGSAPGRPRSEYAVIPVDLKALCADGVNDALNLVTTRGIGDAGFAVAVRDARLVKQFESVATSNSAVAATRARDRALSENVLAVRANAGPDVRIIVWAHNDRVTREAGAMGANLSEALGAAYLPIGFAFGTGRFNAQRPTVSTTTSAEPFTVQVVPRGSIEDALLATNGARLLLDARRIAAGGPAAAPLGGPIAMRTIGMSFDPVSEGTYFPARLFPADFDLLLFVRETTPSTLRPFVN